MTEPHLRMEVSYFSDKAGNGVAVGDYIAYGHNLGRCAGIRFGKVLKIECEVPPPVDGRTRQTAWWIRVVGVDDDWQHNTPALCKGCGTLGYPTRILRANSFIPQYALELLRETKWDSPQ